MFRHIPCIMNDLPKPNLLHTMQMGMIDHLQKWIFHFMETHEQLDKYNAIWVSVTAYYDHTQQTKSYEEFLQWNGMEMKEMSRYLLGVVTQDLRGGSPAQSPRFNGAIDCTQVVLAMGPGNPPAVRVWSGKTVRFTSICLQKPNLELLGGANPYPYRSTCGFFGVWLDLSVPISGSRSQVFLFMVAVRYATVMCKISTLVHDSLHLFYWLPL